MPRPKRDVPWLSQRDNGVYYANWYNAEKSRSERQSLDTKDRDAAVKAFGHFLIAGPDGPRGSSVHGLTVSQAVDDYLREHVEQMDDKGRPYVADQTRQRVIAKHLKAYFKDDVLRAIGPLQCRAYTAARRAGDVGGGKKHQGDHRKGADSTVRRELNMLVATANHAVKWSRLLPTEMPQLELPVAERNTVVMWITQAKLREALTAATLLEMEEGSSSIQKLMHDFILLAYYTAARKHSIEALTKPQVHLDTSRIELSLPGSRTTKKRRPAVPIFAEIRPAVERLMQTPGPLLFGGTVVHNFYHQFVKLMAGLGVTAHPHMLRHSRATHMLMAGENPFKVARLLGDTMATVDRVYAHASPEFLAETKKETGT